MLKKHIILDARSRVREVNRLNRLEKTLWSAVKAGDADALQKVLDIVDRRCRLLNLYAPQTVTVTVEHTGPIKRQGNGADAD